MTDTWSDTWRTYVDTDTLAGKGWRPRVLSPDLPFERCPQCEGRGIIPPTAMMADYLLPQRLARPGTWCQLCEGRGLIDH